MKRSTVLTVLAGLLVITAFALAGCAGEEGAEGPAGAQGAPGPQGPEGATGPAGEAMTTADLSCTECHTDDSLITGKQTAWSESTHGSGEAYLRGGSSSCAGCHSGGGFSDRIAAGLDPDEVEAGDPNPTRQDCRACHQIHTSYTGADFALETTDPVDLYALEGMTFDGGLGNLCANCHQPRRVIGEVVDGMIEITSSHWGPHHGAETAMMLGQTGAGDVESVTSPHYAVVEDTCVGCHMGDGRNHTFEPNVAACQACHSSAEDFDINGVQTEVQAGLAELEEGLIALGWLDEEGHPTVTSVPEKQAVALWNWIFIAHEDGSSGVHNPAYTKALIEAGLAALEP